MNERPERRTGSANVRADWRADAARADGAVADYSRGLAAKVGVPRADAERDDCDLAGHRVTELTPAAGYELLAPWAPRGILADVA